MIGIRVGLINLDPIRLQCLLLDVFLWNKGQHLERLSENSHQLSVTDQYVQLPHPLSAGWHTESRIHTRTQPCQGYKTAHQSSISWKISNGMSYLSFHVLLCNAVMYLKSWAKRTAAYKSRHLYALSLMDDTVTVLLPTVPEVHLHFSYTGRCSYRSNLCESMRCILNIFNAGHTGQFNWVTSLSFR